MKVLLLSFLIWVFAFAASGLAGTGTPLNIEASYNFACTNDEVTILLSRKFTGHLTGNSFSFDGVTLNKRNLKTEQKELVDKFFKHMTNLIDVRGDCLDKPMITIPGFIDPYMVDKRLVGASIIATSDIPYVKNQILYLMFTDDSFEILTIDCYIDPEFITPVEKTSICKPFSRDVVSKRK